MVWRIVRDAQRSKRRPWVAGVLNAFAAPLGYVYVAELKRGLAVWLTVLAATGSGMLLMTRPHGLLSIGIVVAIPLLGWALVVGDAWRLASRKRADWHPGPTNRWFVYLAVGVMLVAIGELVPSVMRSYLVRAYRIPSSAMRPTLVPGDHILVDNWSYLRADPARYHVVVFEAPQSPGRFFIKRIVGLPGEIIEMQGDRILINGQQLQDDIERAGAAATDAARREESFGPVRIPDGQYFLLNENGDARSDSRSWGTVPRRNILGAARSIYWSWDAEEAHVRWDRVGQPIR